jgi:TonB family protein
MAEFGVALLALAVLAPGIFGQQAPVVAQTPAVDASLLVAEALVGKALFLRGFYLANDLSFDAKGRVQGTPKVGDWTLAAMNVMKVERRGPETMELDGVRAAIRYNVEQHVFERHPLNDEKMKVLVGDAGAKAFEAAVAAVFAVGIDPGLQRAMPDYWRHYFDPGLAWAKDELDGVTVFASAGLGNPAKDVTPPVAKQHEAEPKFTSFAEHDKVHGPIRLRLVVDALGAPRRIAIAQPLGYGLDQQAVEAVKKWRFVPGVQGNTPVATGVVVQQDFEFVPVRR